MSGEFDCLMESGKDCSHIVDHGTSHFHVEERFAVDYHEFHGLVYSLCIDRKHDFSHGLLDLAAEPYE